MEICEKSVELSEGNTLNNLYNST